MRQSIGLSVLVCAVSRCRGRDGPRCRPRLRPAAGRGAAVAAPTNLQVLPKDMTQQQVYAFMRTFTQGLGVMCDHCHVGTQAERAKDDKPEKAIARKMIKMMMAINDDFLKDVGDRPRAGQDQGHLLHLPPRRAEAADRPPAGGGLSGFDAIP